MAIRDTDRHDTGTRRDDTRHRQRGNPDASIKAQETDEPQREGDVLGISDAPLNVGEPHSVPGGGRRPSGIEVRDRATGLGDVPQHDGASGVDMGGGGEGTDVRLESPRERSRTNR
jgi:hypothetical protein